MRKDMIKFHRIYKISLWFFPILWLAFVVNSKSLSREDSAIFWNAFLWVPVCYICLIVGYFLLKKEISEEKGKDQR
ncbi:hypothetical protein PAECIP111802_04955 [Paenibacillus allorhizosphaerae]|uniref:2TM domain-containing protein n=1 Tax=Paenibacillus allorhizosphaerae TaxID=2849866 RepID=A0ABM8VNG1_9BACL|nr:hypothetical protein PAECIP111802_04955 [Paenibacillus allorhizosphaerae]